MDPGVVSVENVVLHGSEGVHVDLLFGFEDNSSAQMVYGF